MNPWNDPRILDAARRLALDDVSNRSKPALIPAWARVELNSDELALAYFLSRSIQRIASLVRAELNRN